MLNSLSTAAVPLSARVAWLDGDVVRFKSTCPAPLFVVPPGGAPLKVLKDGEASLTDGTLQGASTSTGVAVHAASPSSPWPFTPALCVFYPCTQHDRYRAVYRARQVQVCAWLW